VLFFSLGGGGGGGGGLGGRERAALKERGVWVRGGGGGGWGGACRMQLQKKVPGLRVLHKKKRTPPKGWEEGGGGKAGLEKYRTKGGGEGGVGGGGGGWGGGGGGGGLFVSCLLLPSLISFKQPIKHKYKNPPRPSNKNILLTGTAPARADRKHKLEAKEVKGGGGSVGQEATPMKVLLGGPRRFEKR